MPEVLFNGISQSRISVSKQIIDYLGKGLKVNFSSKYLTANYCNSHFDWLTGLLMYYINHSLLLGNILLTPITPNPPHLLISVYI